MSKTMLITGCSGGIGKALAIEAKRQGYRVFATARKEADLVALQHLGLETIALEMTEADSVKEAAVQLKQQVGRLDILVNNAGFGVMGPVLDAGAEGLRQQFEVNVFAVMDLTQACLPLLIQSKGLIVNIGSVSGVLTTPFAGVYCASKAALHSLSDALRMELAPLGVRVLTVQPGAIDTGFANRAKLEAEQLLKPDSFWWSMREGVLLRANASQNKPTSAESFANSLMKQLDKANCSGVVGIGHGAVSLILLARLLPQKLLDKILRRKFKLI
ncbi:SDR family oxidoreductase [Rheinheimera sp.]|uniref:SDR family oxidoreductase n=1 Tax=Rheinheimera sp. TaxID=1869214 RepID=UPI00263348C5|nr:SDR family oxidoreductase [Rheinheimera sp.]MCA1929997.1 SDR family oxidoreductase [Rheinheimera sp.]